MVTSNNSGIGVGAGALTVAFPGSDFIAHEAPKRQAVMLWFGRDKAGKTTILTRYCPEPVVLFNFDNRARHAVAAAVAAGRKVLLGKFARPGNVLRMDDSTIKKEVGGLLDKAMRNLEIAVREAQKGNVRTIGFDTATELGEVLKLAVTGRVDRVKDYGKSDDLVARQLWHIFNIVRECPAHLVMLARSKDIWKNNEPTGACEPRCSKVVTAGVDWIGEIGVKLGRDQVTGEKKPRWQVEVKDAGANIGELGAVYKDEDWQELGGPFAFAAMLQYGGDPSDWI